MRKIIIVSLFFIQAGAAPSPSEPVDVVIQRDVESFRNYKESQNIGVIIEKYGYSVVAAVDKYTKDTDLRVRIYAYMLIDGAASRSTDVAERQNAVEKLLRAAYTDTEYKAGLQDRLLKYRSQDFSHASAKQIREKFTENPDYRTILLVGIVGGASDIKVLKINRDKIKGTLKSWGKGKEKDHDLAFAAMMACARMGDEEDIKKCIELVNAYPDEDFKVGFFLADFHIFGSLKLWNI